MSQTAAVDCSLPDGITRTYSTAAPPDQNLSSYGNLPLDVQFDSAGTMYYAAIDTVT